MQNDLSKSSQFSTAKILIYLLACFVILICSCKKAKGNPLQGLIYAKVTLAGGATQQGIIQWNNRQLFWEDVFETRRKDAKTLDFLTKDEISKLSDQQKRDKIEWGFMHVWENKYPSKSNKFSCRFGDITSIVISGEKDALLTIKNGSTIRVKGDQQFGDVGSRVRLIDQKGKWHRIEWKQIQKIDFMSTPAQALSSPVRALFGTVKTNYGTVTGHIKWDQDETLTSSTIDGENQGKEHKIPFGKIHRIKKTAANSCELTLISREKIILSSGDDVGTSNHGLTVFVEDLGSIFVEWENFKELTLGQAGKEEQLLAYADFKAVKALWAEVKTIGGERYKGKLLYDLDEQWACEILEGHQSGIVYSVVLGNIRSVERKNQNHCWVLLKNGERLLLDGHADVNDTNWGILIWIDNGNPRYIAWDRIKMINLR
ncbi:hypothetical protein DYBT9623_05307 [Dyadobacter sp. CECT 9623]|uniref:Uncharacterized protein n=1 Tax=Dyadobacter linearis TaxID=2823330 RepID=A0ABN7RJ49_9BACT|nr:hypothetical protein [Dyadobacter sp. CECT 9623]CAG5074620.1 hypothetical protein DYBT9623_05307 [Dyadobacter sp. CECT 9623]